ncbi:MAG: DUF1254 domain-containing protein [Verrucomicrobiaceae bacterium]|nr:DUF1254 domain-containing protein [Verrucomicrobiaceae bacterium]
MKTIVIKSIAALALTLTAIPAAQAQLPDKQTVTDAYVYLLGRAIAIRQEHTDLKEPGIAYNVIKYNPAGSADFVNPNLDVAYLEAWIAVDDKTPVLLEVPEVKGRYYTAQILNEWGEVITNLNQRNYPSHPYGKFAFVAPGSTAEVQTNAVRIELHSHKAKLLGRVELKTDPAGAMALQKQFKLTPLGKPVIQSAAPMPNFGNKELIGVELFDNVDAVLASALDVSSIAPQMQEKAREIGRQAKNPTQREALDKLIKEEVVPQFLKYAVTKSGVFQNNWLATLGTGNYGADYWKRTSANLVGLWANANDEVIYFVATRDADGQPLNGSNDYVLEFSAANRPDAVVNAYWSVILVDVPDYRVVKNPLNRFNFNSDSGLKSEADGSLKILFASKPNAAVPESNWLPSAPGKGFSLTLRTYVPKDLVKRGEWFPPAIKRLK